MLTTELPAVKHPESEFSCVKTVYCTFYKDDINVENQNELPNVRHSSFSPSGN